MKILYLTPSSFRTVNAGALRNANVAAALALGGHTVEIHSGDHSDDRTAEEWGSTLMDRVSIVPSGSSRRGHFARFLRLARGPRLVVLEESRPDVLMAYNPSPVAFIICRIVSRSRGIPLVLDMTEWLGLRDQPGGLLSPLAWSYEVFMQFLPALMAGQRAISISESMKRHLTSRGAEVLVVPPLASVGGCAARPASRDSMHIVISGTALKRGGKDADTLRVLAEVARRRSRALDGVVIHILGIPDERLLAQLGRLIGPSNVVPHGWVPWRHALEVLRDADWFVLLRDPRRRRNRFGFPSKVIESLALGLPVITNVCGDACAYLTGDNALVVENCSSEALAAALIQAKSIDSMSYARSDFSPDAWTGPLCEFLLGSQKA